MTSSRTSPNKPLEKEEREMKKLSTERKVILFLAGLIIVSSALAFYATDFSLSRSMQSADIEDLTFHYTDEVTSQTILQLKFSISNLGPLPLTVKDVDGVLLLNGTNYDSRWLNFETQYIEPGKSKEIVYNVQLSGSPISQLNGQETFDLDVDMDVTLATNLLGLSRTLGGTVSYNQQVTLIAE